MLTFIVISLISQAVLALAVVSRNSRDRTNILFGMLTIVLGLWALVNYISSSDPFADNILTLMRLVMLLVVVQNTLFFLFSKVLAKQKDIFSKRVQWLMILSLVAALLAISPILFVEVQPGASGANPVPGPAMPVFLAHAILSVAGGIRYQRRRLKMTRGSERRQLRTIFIASLVLWIIVPITNFVVPLVFQSVVFVQLSPIYTLIFSGIIGYAIVKHKFFDIRLIVARSIAYALLLVTFAALYGLAIFAVSEFLFEADDITGRVNILYTALALVLAFTFQPLRRFFDKFTSKLFYQDAYDSQVLLRELSELMAEEIDLQVIGDGSLEIITSTMKPTYARFVVLDQGKIYKYLNHGDTPESTISASDLSKLKKGVVLRDELATNSRVYKLLEQYEISVASQLKTKEGVVGYLLMGGKQSGNAYSSQDVKVLDIIASELAIGIENARAFEQIREFNETLQLKVKEATAKLRKSNEKLRKLDEAKDEFISMASHQLRTPLTTIKGYLSMILEGDMGTVPKEQQVIIDRAYTSSQRMVYLISDLLNVSRLSTGKFIIERKAINLVEIAQSELTSLAQHFEAKKIKYEFNHPKEVPTMQLDEGKIRQVIMNFVDNAIYYTPEGGDIEVRIDVSEKQLEFRVIDSGIGVPKEAQAKLFAKFFRAGNAQKMRPDGTGLGLFLARKVVVGHGGAIIFKSKEGEGSTFGFSFPLN